MDAIFFVCNNEEQTQVADREDRRFIARIDVCSRMNRTKNG